MVNKAYGSNKNISINLLCHYLLSAKSSIHMLDNVESKIVLCV